VGLAIAGGQVSRDADKPNLGMSTTEIKDRGGIPPSELPERGYFTARFYLNVASVGIPYMNIEERKAAIARLPRHNSVVKVTAAGAALSTLLLEVLPHQHARETVPYATTEARMAGAAADERLASTTYRYIAAQ